MPTLTSTLKSSPHEIAGLVPMPDLLLALGFEANERTRRAPCILHRGSNRTAFSWREDGRWHCFSCERGGDKIALIRAVRQCSFSEAVDVLAALAGVEYRPGRQSLDRIKRARGERESLRHDAEMLLASEHGSWRKAQGAVLQLEAIRRGASARLHALYFGAPERWRDEMEHAWDALAGVYRNMPKAVAGYHVASFAPHKDRLAFALDSQALEELIAEVLDRGYVADERDHPYEVQL
jgi:hypothetical protein